MASKVVQLDMFPELERESFEQVAVKSFRALFARDTKREKEIEELQEIIFRMNDRLNHVADTTPKIQTPS